MFLICNLVASPDEQFLFLETLLSDDDRIYFIAEHPFAEEKNRVVHLPIRRLFPKVPFLRALFVPLFPYFQFRTLKHRNVMVIHDEIFSLTMIHAVFAKVFLGSKTVVYCAENLMSTMPQQILGRLFARFIDEALCPSEEAYRQTRSIGVKKVYRCPLVSAGKESGEIRYTKQIKRIGFFGRLNMQKGILLLCEAMKQFPELEFIVYGDGPRRDEVKKYHATYKGVYTRDRLDQVFAEIDLLVVPSITMPQSKEQFGRVIVEAMSRGVLVIGSSSGTIPATIGNEQLIFQENSVPAITQKIRQLLSFPSAQLEQISRCLRDRFEREFSIPVINKIVLSAIRELFES